MATSPDRRVAGLVIAAALLAGCTAGSGHPGRTGRTPVSTRIASRPGTATASASASASASSGRSVPTDGGVALGSSAGPCKVALPKSWSAAMYRGELWSDARSSHATGVPMPDAQDVLAEDDSARTSTITLRGPDRAVARTVARVPRPGGHGSMSDEAADARNVAFVYSTVDGEQAQNAWRLYLWDRSGGAARVVARNPADGSGRPLPGGWVHPLLTGSALYWLQAARNAVGRAIGAAGSALMRYDLATHRTSVVYSGLATSLVAYRDDVLITAASDSVPRRPGVNPPLVVRAFDQRTGAEAAAPAGITAGADQPDWFVAGGDLLVWNTANGAIKGWRPAWGRSVTLVPRFSTWRTALRNDPPMGYPSYPRVLGHLLAWNSTATFVLDLRTDSFVQLTHRHGAMEASGSRLAMWQYVKDVPPAPGAPLETAQWVLDTAGLARLPGCR